MTDTTGRPHRLPSRTVAGLRLTCCLAVEAAVLTLLVRAATPAGTPPLGAGIGTWWSANDPLDAAASVARVIAVAATTYVVAVTALHLLAVVSRGRRLGRVATRLGPRFLVGMAATATSVVATVAPPALAADAPAPPGAGATMEVLDAAPAPRTWLPWAEEHAVTLAVSPATQSGDPEPTPPPPPPPTTALSEVVVHAGDSMWSIAEDELTARLGRAPTDAEIDPYWRALIAANRDRLADPGEPGLIYPGQTFDLP